MAEPTQILVVDDDDDVRGMLELVLAHAGFGVAAVADGEQAIERLRASEPAPIVLLDLRMPVMNGWDVIDMLRAEGRLPHIPIIICTSSPSDAPEGFDIIRKPVRLETLVAAIRKVERSRAAATSA